MGIGTKMMSLKGLGSLNKIFNLLGLSFDAFFGHVVTHLAI